MLTLLISTTLVSSAIDRSHTVATLRVRVPGTQSSLHPLSLYLSSDILHCLHGAVPPPPVLPGHSLNSSVQGSAQESLSWLTGKVSQSAYIGGKGAKGEPLCK